MWSKLDEIGPKLKKKNIPEVIIDSMIETDIDVVKENWVSDFSGLYADIYVYQLKTKILTKYFFKKFWIINIITHQMILTLILLIPPSLIQKSNMLCKN